MSGGIILLDKPAGMTSMACDNFIKKIMGTKKVGHGGTLDPFATGLLPVFWGDALKVVRYTDGYDKAYRCEAVFGLETDTEDTEGTAVGGRMPSSEELSKLAASDYAPIREAFAKVAKMTEQVPPLYSAKKIDGKKAYELAREGKSYELAPCKIRIDSLDIVSIREQDGFIRCIFDIACSKGTYIRSVCRDAGRICGFGAHAAALRRTASGPFRVEAALTPDAVREMTGRGEKDKISVSREEALSHLPVYEPDEKEFRDLILGRKIPVRADAGLQKDVLYRAVKDGRTVAVIFLKEEEGRDIIRIDRMLWKDD